MTTSGAAMDRIRYFAEISVRRAVGFGLLAIATIAVGLSADPEIALRATAILLSLEAAILVNCALGTGRVPYKRREIWLLLDKSHGLHESMAQQAISDAMRTAQLIYAKRLAGPAAFCWMIDLGNRLFG